MTSKNRRGVVCGKLLLSATGLLALVGCDNQVNRPPFVPPAPVVHKLPELISLLESTKTRCESRVNSAIGIIQQDRLDVRIANAGRELYSEVAAEVNGCVQFLQAALEIKFKEGDEQQVAKSLAIIEKRMSKFIAWEEKLEQPNYGALIDPWQEVIGALRQIMADANRRDEVARARLGELIERCRMKTWDEIHQSLTLRRPSTVSLSTPAPVYVAPNQR